jgi:hypothetical protein
LLSIAILNSTIKNTAAHDLTAHCIYGVTLIGNVSNGTLVP